MADSKVGGADSTGVKTQGTTGPKPADEVAPTELSSLKSEFKAIKKQDPKEVEANVAAYLHEGHHDALADTITGAADAKRSLQSDGFSSEKKASPQDAPKGDLTQMKWKAADSEHLVAKAGHTGKGGEVIKNQTDGKAIKTHVENGKETTVTRKEYKSGHEVPKPAQEDGKNRAQKLSKNVDGTATLAVVEGKSNWVGVGQAKTEKLGDKTGVEGEAHVLSAQGGANAALGVNVKKGEMALGAQASVVADVVGASGKAQLGSVNTAQGALVGKAEVHVGAQAKVGAGLDLNLNKGGTLKVGVGGEVFAGAEVKASGAYQNKYFGAEAEVRGQAGAGAAGRAEIGFEEGKFKASMDLGAALGVGGRATVNVNVNVAAIVNDSAETVINAADKVATATKDAALAVADTAVELGKTAVEGAKVVGDAAVQGAKAVGRAASDAVDAAADGAKAVGGAISSAASSVGSSIASGWNSLWDW